MSLDDEEQPYFDAAEVGTLGSVLVYTCSSCDFEEHAPEDQEPDALLDAGVCPKCGAARELGMHDMATTLNELLGTFVEAVQNLRWLAERVPELAPEIEVKIAEVDQVMERLRQSVGGE